MRRRPVDERGVVGGTDGLLAGVLVAMVGTLMIANVWSVIAARTDAGAAVREYLRVYTKADGPGSGAARAEAAARGAGRFGPQRCCGVDHTTRCRNLWPMWTGPGDGAAAGSAGGGARFRRSRIQDRHRCRRRGDRSLAVDGARHRLA